MLLPAAACVAGVFPLQRQRTPVAVESAAAEAAAAALSRCTLFRPCDTSLPQQCRSRYGSSRLPHLSHLPLAPMRSVGAAMAAAVAAVTAVSPPAVLHPTHLSLLLSLSYLSVQTAIRHLRTPPLLRTLNCATARTLFHSPYGKQCRRARSNEVHRDQLQQLLLPLPLQLRQPAVLKRLS